MALLLSPAGSPEALKAAVAAGADEVYLGGLRFNARAGARNFTPDQLREAGELCRAAGVRLHVTMNTLVRSQELDSVMEDVRFLEENVRPDAYIVQDLGLAFRIRASYPDAVLHASTQLRQHASPASDILKSLGFSRVVLAREMPKEDIASYVRNSPIGTEVFVHGALCVCESGGCLMSSVIGRRSGNRGECAQPCRLPYRGANGHPLSLKDNCLAAHLKELSDMGVTAFKIEGRMKSPDYVFRVTSVYRRLMDEGRPPEPEELRELKDAFSRSGFTDAYYTGKITQNMFGVRREEDADRSRETAGRAARGKKSPQTAGKAKDFRETPFPILLPDKKPDVILSPKEQVGYVARTEGRVPSSLSVFSDANRIDIPIRLLPRADIRGMEDKISVILPRVTFDSERDGLRILLEDAKKRGVRRATVPNLSDLPMLDGFILHGDYPLNVYSPETRDLLEAFSFSSLFLSPEADPFSFGPSSAAMEALGYGRIPLMQTQTCLIRNILGKCPAPERNGSGRETHPCRADLVDRANASFPVLRADGHRNILYNSVPTYRLDRRRDLRKAGVGLCTLLFTTETDEEIRTVLQCFRSGETRPPFPYTRR
ncbi:MAG: U32 family peptidase [Clostridia bacterium]|nr:U32 family peptidase [Clostridia bacterium]